VCLVLGIVIQERKMKIVKVSIELVIDDDMCEIIEGVYNKDCIVEYLNNKLYEDPEWFGDFGPENIVEIKDFD
jgi:hypothetical protein